jgi:hypothetical protein
VAASPLAARFTFTITAAALQPRHPPGLNLKLLKINLAQRGTGKQKKLL